MPDTAESISSQAQVRSYIVHNVTYDVKEKNIYVHPLVPGLTMESYVPSTQDSTGFLYLNIPANTGAERTFRITVDVLDDNGAIIDTETGVTVTQAGRPKVVDIELNVDAAFHKEDVEIDLYGE